MVTIEWLENSVVETTVDPVDKHITLEVRNRKDLLPIAGVTVFSDQRKPNEPRRPVVDRPAHAGK